MRFAVTVSNGIGFGTMRMRTITKGDEMEMRALKGGDIVQLNPKTVGNKAFAGCYMTVTDSYDWGAQGYVQALGEDRETMGGQAYYRAKWEEMEHTEGGAVWIMGD
jgi:hypothetical protein